MTKQKKLEQLEDKGLALARLTNWVTADTTIYTLTNYTSRNSQTDYVRVFIILNNEIVEITWHCAQLLEYSQKDKGLALRGYGYSKSNSVVIHLSRELGLGKLTHYKL